MTYTTKTKTTRYVFLLIIILFTSVHIFSQNTKTRKIDFDIRVELNDNTHSLLGYEKIRYRNYSKQALTQIYFHLYPNAYKDRESALCKELVAANDVSLYYAEAEQRGYIDSLHFTVNGQAADFELHPKYKDIGILSLKEALLPMDSIEIETPFFVKIPGNFSRLSHVGQSYQICQWYPKPAVYDDAGWHAMPYHDQGEFYSEFAHYKVAITLPSNYIVGASGILQEEKEIAFMNNRAADTSIYAERFKKSEPSSSVMKTITFVQDSIHDFAWFADKRFIVRKGILNLSSNQRNVTCWVLHTGYKLALWDSALFYTQRAIQFYSKKIGEYPYQQYTVVDGTVSAGGGMEYPLITNVNTPSNAKELDIVITHEVGHSWFYGILASDEREEPWLDEGLNSYYEYLYTKEYYPSSLISDEFTGSKFINRIIGLHKFEASYATKLAYLIASANQDDPAIQQHARSFTPFQYGAIVYSKTPLVLDYIASFIGADAFELAIKSYYSQFAFKHPTSINFKNQLQLFSKQDLNQLFTVLIETNQLQKTSIQNIKKSKSNELIVSLNKKPASLPIPFRIYSSGSYEDRWFQESKITLHSSIDSFNIFSDERHISKPYENSMVRNDGNSWKIHNRKLLIRAIGIIRNPNHRQLNILPVIGWNNTDKLMAGIILYNSPLPAPRFEYRIMPMFGIGSLQATGMAHFAYHIYPAVLHALTFQCKMQRFSYNDYLKIPEIKTKSVAFFQIQPSIIIHFKNASVHSASQKSLALKSSIVYQEFGNDFYKGNVIDHWYQTSDITFQYKNTKKINPYNAISCLQFSSDFASLSQTLEYSISYNKSKSAVTFRLFGAYMFYKKPIAIDLDKGLLPPNRSLTISSNPAVGNYLGKMNEDFTYESVYLDRSAQSKVLSHQVFINKEGGFRSMIGTGIGNSDKWIFTLSASATVPKRIPIKPFACIGTGYLFDYKSSSYKHGVFIAEAGFSLVGISNIFEIHFPLLVTNNIKENQKFNFGIDKFYERITFTLDINLLQPFKRIRELSFIN